MDNYLLLLAGVACAALGGELFVTGAVGIARWARIARHHRGDGGGFRGA